MSALTACASAPSGAGEHATDEHANAANAPDDAAATSTSTGPTAAESEAFASVSSYARAALAATGTPGASLAVVLHGKLAFAEGLGVKKKGGAEPVGTSTLFRVGSMSKMVLAATAMSLVEEGALDLHAPITKYLPWFRLKEGFDAESITLEHLLTHTSGFPADTIGFCDRGTDGTRRDFFSTEPQPLWAPPGAAWTYSNAGYSLASLVLTAAAHENDIDYEALVRERVFAPLGMTTATFDAVAVTKGDHAAGHDLDANGRVMDTIEPAALDCPMLHAPGGVDATATDYAHFAEMLLAKGGTLLSADSVAAMEAAHVDVRETPGKAYGYGLFSEAQHYGDHVVIEHPGAVPGFSSQMDLVPDLGLGVIVLLNGVGSGAPYDDITRFALDAFSGEKPLHPKTATAASTWATYEGAYDDAWGMYGKGIRVALSEAHTFLEFDAPNAVDALGRATPLHGSMRQLATDTFILPDGTEATFFPNAAGVPTYLATRIGTAVRR